MLCSSYSGNTEETLSGYDDALERGAPRLVATTGGALAERARRDGVPVIPLPGGFQPRAAVGYGLVSALEAAALAGAAPSIRDEIEAAAALAESLAAEWGPDAPEDSEAKALAHAPARHGAGDRRRRADGARRLPLEVPGQRERRACPRSPRSCRARPQRGRRLAGVARQRARSPRSSSRTPAAHPRNAAAVRAHRRDRRRGRRRRRARHRPRRDAARAPRLARAPRRPRLALPGRPRRRRPGRHRADRPRSRPHWHGDVAGMSTLESSRPGTGAGAPSIASVIDGEARTDAPGGRLTSTNPARTDEVVAEVALADAATFADACRAARAAQKEWAKVPAPARGRVIAQVGRLFETNKEALAQLVTREVGKPYRRVARRGAGDHRHLRLLHRRGPAPVRADGPLRDARQAAVHVPHAGRRRGDHHRRQLPRRRAGLVPRAGHPVRQRRRVEAGRVRARAGRRDGQASSTPAASPAACST